MEYHNRKLPRMKNYDYSSEGYYFVTICTNNRKCLLSSVGNGLDHSLPSQDNKDYIIDDLTKTPHNIGNGFDRSVVKLKHIGKITEDELLKIPFHFDCVNIDSYVIMPNHVHCIIIIGCRDVEWSRPFPTLSTVVGLYKSGVSRIANEKYQCIEIWQSSFHDKIIRNNNNYTKARQYIFDNPMRWNKDKYHIDE